MQLDDSTSNYDSAQDYHDRLQLLVDAGAGVIHVRTTEVVRAAIETRRQGLKDEAAVHEWDIVNGWRDIKSSAVDAMVTTGDGNIDIGAAMKRPLDELRQGSSGRGSGDGKKKYFIFVNPHHFMQDNPEIAQLLTVYSHQLPSTEISVILITPDIPLPNNLNDSILSIHFNTPGLSELTASLSSLLSDISDDFGGNVPTDEDEIRAIAQTGAGLGRNQFEMYAALAAITAGHDGEEQLTPDMLREGIAQGKTEVVKNSDILELFPTENMGNVGGLENLKEWVAMRRDCYSEEAKEFGIEPPKGIVLVGPPGTGKSLVAKAVASELGVPLVRLDFGRVFSSFVGSSEQRMRQALRMVESMAPIVLFCDEIDKGLGGIGGSGDSGTSSRVLGSFLTWLQECKKPVFVMVTANNVTGLPPEMLRRGRFDAIFSTNMPTPTERREVLRIHLARRGRDIKDFPRTDVDAIVQASDGYLPAEIESAVKDGLVSAFSRGEEFTLDDVSKALSSMVPLSRAFAAQIQAMSEWAANNATPAGKPEIRKDDHAPSANTRRVSTRSRRA